LLQDSSGGKHVHHVPLEQWGVSIVVASQSCKQEAINPDATELQVKNMPFFLLECTYLPLENQHVISLRLY
jgi:hypothetical protein